MRRVLVVLLGLGMALLSFDALRAYALTGRPLTDGVIPAETIIDRPWLAMLWALVIDVSVAAGILGVKDDRRDWRAWLMLLLALGATLGFQVFALSPFVARAVPPVGLALAILVLDLGPPRPKPATPERPPVPARLRSWLGSWDQAAPTQPEPAQGPGRVAPKRREAPARATTRRTLTDQERTRVAELVGEDWSAQAISRDLGLSDRHRKELVGPLVRELRNGDRPKVDA